MTDFQRVNLTGWSTVGMRVRHSTPCVLRPLRSGLTTIRLAVVSAGSNGHSYRQKQHAVKQQLLKPVLARCPADRPASLRW